LVAIQDPAVQVVLLVLGVQVVQVVLLVLAVQVAWAAAAVAVAVQWDIQQFLVKVYHILITLVAEVAEVVLAHLVLQEVPVVLQVVLLV
jgi:hypothetical protein